MGMCCCHHDCQHQSHERQRVSHNVLEQQLRENSGPRCGLTSPTSKLTPCPGLRNSSFGSGPLRHAMQKESSVSACLFGRRENDLVEQAGRRL